MFKAAHELVLEAKKSVHEISSETLRPLLGAANALLIDVREPDEYREGHIAGAINIPRGMLEFKVSNEASLQNISRPIILYCKTSGRAALSAVALQSMGFKNVKSLSGGFDAWSSNHHPVVKPHDISFE